eukprot:m.211899 g.211899  ORF g.211899 m.211899 type:complete len:720 (-) comp33112_c0_seq1:199-2358(-)
MDVLTNQPYLEAIAVVGRKVSEDVGLAFNPVNFEVVISSRRTSSGTTASMLPSVLVEGSEMTSTAAERAVSENLNLNAIRSHRVCAQTHPNRKGNGSHTIAMVYFVLVDPKLTPTDKSGMTSAYVNLAKLVKEKENPYMFEDDHQEILSLTIGWLRQLAVSNPPRLEATLSIESTRKAVQLIQNPLFVGGLPSSLDKPTFVHNNIHFATGVLKPQKGSNQDTHIKPRTAASVLRGVVDVDVHAEPIYDSAGKQPKPPVTLASLEESTTEPLEPPLEDLDSDYANITTIIEQGRISDEESAATTTADTKKLTSEVIKRKHKQEPVYSVSTKHKSQQPDSPGTEAAENNDLAQKKTSAVMKRKHKDNAQANKEPVYSVSTKHKSQNPKEPGDDVADVYPAAVGGAVNIERQNPEYESSRSSVGVGGVVYSEISPAVSAQTSFKSAKVKPPPTTTTPVAASSMRNTTTATTTAATTATAQDKPNSTLDRDRIELQQDSAIARDVVITRESPEVSWGFGISKQRTPKGHPTVSLIKKGGAAETALTGELRVGDILVKINGKNSDGLSQKQVTSIIKKSLRLELVVQAPVIINEPAASSSTLSTTTKPTRTPSTASTWFNEEKPIRPESTDDVQQALAGLPVVRDDEEPSQRKQAWEDTAVQRKLSTSKKQLSSSSIASEDHPFSDDLKADFSNPVANPLFNPSPFVNPAAGKFGNIKMTAKFG